MPLRDLYRAKSSFVRCRRSKVNTARLTSRNRSLSLSLCAKLSVNPGERERYRYPPLTTVSQLSNRYDRRTEDARFLCLNFPHVLLLPVRALRSRNRGRGRRARSRKSCHTFSKSAVGKLGCTTYAAPGEEKKRTE